MILLEKLGKGEVINPAASNQMLAILKQQKMNGMIPGKLPGEVQVAHKTGSITGVHHDAGLVILPDGGKYVFVMLSKGAPDSAKVIRMFTDISKDIYDYIVSKQ